MSPRQTDALNWPELAAGLFLLHPSGLTAISITIVILALTGLTGPASADPILDACRTLQRASDLSGPGPCKPNQPTDAVAVERLRRADLRALFCSRRRPALMSEYAYCSRFEILSMVGLRQPTASTNN